MLLKVPTVYFTSYRLLQVTTGYLIYYNLLQVATAYYSLLRRITWARSQQQQCGRR